MTFFARKSGLVAAAICAATLSSPASAELPQPVRDMVEAAIATGDPAKVDTVVGIAKQTNPADVAELDAMQAAFKERQQQLAAEWKAAEEEAIRTAGVFDNWSGKVEVGASRSTGNTDNLGLTVGFRLDRKGLDWQHKFRGSVDIQRNNGTINREKYLVSYEPRYNLSSRAFAFGIAQWERNPFQGFAARYAVSGGIGYRLFDKQDLQLSIKAGPAWRLTDYTIGGSDSSFGALAGLDFDWAITDRLKLTQDANMVANTGGSAVIIIDSNNTSINLVTGLEAKISDSFSTRLSYSIDHDSNPPAGKVKTDTLSRVTLVYGF